jgi:hypothetical protein
MAESEIDRILRETFGDAAAEAEGLSGPVDQAIQRQETGYAHQVTYEGSPQTQRSGAVGTAARSLAEAWQKAFSGIRRKQCPPWLTPDCLELLSRGIEQTFRNFQLTGRRPSHIDPPFSATAIDEFPRLGNVVIGLAAVTVASFTMPRGHFRGVISSIGQALESEAAFADVNWIILRNGAPVGPWGTFRQHAFQFSPPTHLCSPIHLRGGDTVSIQAASVAAPPHNAGARLCGWFYPVRVEADDNIRSTLVD